MRNKLLGLGLVWFATGCLDTETPTSPTSDPPAPHQSPRVLEHATGRWIELGAIQDSALTAKCPGCELAIVHDVTTRDGAYADAITVFDTRSGSSLCTMSRTYSPAADQAYGDAGELVDYEMVSDTCGIGPIGVVHESYALWEATRAGVLEVLEDAPPPGAAFEGSRPFTAWWRCATFSPNAMCTLAPQALAVR